MTVELTGARNVGAYETALVTIAIQNATAKLGHIIRDPRSETTQARRSDREQTQLIPRGQSNGTLFFGFPTPEDSPALDLFGDRPRTLAETAARELCEILPRSAEDDGALDAVLAQRSTVRSAVSDLVDAVTEISTGFGLRITSDFGETVTSELSMEQAVVLQDSLRETRTDRRTQQLTGRLDGVRTRRRIFYLELETGGEIHGAVGPESDLMQSIRQNLDRQVIATIESEQIESLAGRRARPTYRLLRLETAPTLFDE
jgi:hypothetical protein